MESHQDAHMLYQVAIYLNQNYFERGLRSKLPFSPICETKQAGCPLTPRCQAASRDLTMRHRSEPGAKRTQAATASSLTCISRLFNKTLVTPSPPNLSFCVCLFCLGHPPPLVRAGRYAPSHRAQRRLHGTRTLFFLPVA